MLGFFLDCGIQNLTEKKLKELFIFANAGASLITTKKGTLKVIPEKTEIEVLINEGGFKS